MAEYRGVNNVARKVTKEYRGAANVARRIVRAYRGVANVARLYFGEINNDLKVSFHVPTWNGYAMVDDEYAGFDGNSIRLSFENAVVSSSNGSYVCRVYVRDTDNSFWGETLKFDYSLKGHSSSYTTWEVQYKDSLGGDISYTSLGETEGASHSSVIPENTSYIAIGVWSSLNDQSGEMIITNMYVGDERII